MGADIVFSAQGASEPGMRAVGASRLFTLSKPLPPSPPLAGRPSSGRAILPGDFSGRFDLLADGQWSGRLDLEVDASGAVSGSFRSEKNGTAYPVTGTAGEGGARRIRFEVKFPRARASLRRTDLERGEKRHRGHGLDARPALQLHCGSGRNFASFRARREGAGDDHT